MPITRNNICLDCENCHFKQTNSSSSFQIEVPVESLLSGRKGRALILCEVYQDRHELTVLSLEGPSGFELQLDELEKEYLGNLLETVAKKQLCGNKALCPEEVVSTVLSSVKAE